MDEKTVQKMIDDSIAKAIGTPQTPENAQSEGSNQPVEKAITEEKVAEMVSAAVAKAMEPNPKANEGAQITAENLASVIDSAVAKAMEPVLKAKGLPSNLNNDGTVAKSNDQHYMTGMF